MERRTVRAHTIFKAMLDDGAFVELAALLLPVAVAAAMLVSYLVG
jgi:hypothetical protein